MITKQGKHVYTLSMAFVIFFITNTTYAQEAFIQTAKKDGYFTWASAGKCASLFTDTNDYPGVTRAAKDLQLDINRVTDTQPSLLFTKPEGKEIIIIGTIGKNQWIDQLIASKKIDVSDVQGKWESSIIQTVEKPFPGVDRA